MNVHCVECTVLRFCKVHMNILVRFIEMNIVLLFFISVYEVNKA